jgi:steroid delta-isomerase-like uncharacterized protein
MPLNHTQTIVRRLYEEVLNAGDLDLARHVIADEAIDHTPPLRSSLPIETVEALEDFLVEFCTAFPDVSWTIDEIRADLATVVVRTTVTGNHHGAFRGLRPTGGQFALAGKDTVRVRDGKIVEHWGELDMKSLTRQLAPQPPTREQL